MESTEPAVENLYPALTQCFGIILCGYFAGRMNWVSEAEVKGMNMFVGTFSLPALIFMSLAKLDLSSVNWMFLLSVLIAKSVVFFSVITVTLLLLRTFDIGRAGLFAIFCTQSNDFAIGYPLVETLYKHTHKEYASYLYLLAPTNLAILNPIGFVLMEIGKLRSNVNHQQENLLQPRASGYTNKDRLKVIADVGKSIFLNPIVFMTVLGIAGNLLLKHHVPVIIGDLLNVLGAAFSASALFLLGIRMVGKVHKFTGVELVIPGILIMVKLIALPLVTREVISALNAGSNETDTLDLSTFGFLYGTFPTAPGVFVFANQYALEQDLIANAMVACTFLSAPLMFISAKMITLTKTKPSDYIKELDSFTLDISIIGFIVCIWVLVLFFLNRKISKLPHKISGCLVISQLLGCLGAILWNTINEKEGWFGYIQMTIFIIGIYSSRLWTTVLAIALVFLQCRSLCFVLNMQPHFMFVGWGIPVIIAGVLLAVIGKNGVPFNQRNPNFVYGQPQAIISVSLLLLCFVVTTGCLILHQRYRRRFSEYVAQRNSFIEEISGNLDEDTEIGPAIAGSSTNGLLICNLPTINEGINEESPIVDIEDLFRSEARSSNARASLDELCPSDFGCRGHKRDKCHNIVQHYQEQVDEDMEFIEAEAPSYDPQILRHVVLLILLLCSMFVGLALCLWTLFKEQVQMSGIYVELSFLDATLNFGQSIIVFAIFGLNTNECVTTFFVKIWRKVWYGANTLNLPAHPSGETLNICQQFVNFHKENCRKAIAKDKRWRLKIYKNVFTGHDLVKWLIQVGLAHDKAEAIIYGRHLIDGRVLWHINKVFHFYDRSLLYTFD